MILITKIAIIFYYFSVIHKDNEWMLTTFNQSVRKNVRKRTNRHFLTFPFYIQKNLFPLLFIEWTQIFNRIYVFVMRSIPSLVLLSTGSYP